MTSRARFGGHSVLLAAVVVSVAADLPGASAASGADDVTLSSCVILSDDQSPDQPASATRVLPEALRPPPTERELREIVRVLGRDEGDTPVRLLSKVEIPSPSLARMGVLVGDVRAVGAVLDAQEALKQLNSIPNVAPATRQWMEARLSAIRRCALRRFEARGGDPAFMQTAALVEKLRGEIDPVIFRPRPRRGAPAGIVP